MSGQEGPTPRNSGEPIDHLVTKCVLEGTIKCRTTLELSLGTQERTDIQFKLGTEDVFERAFEENFASTSICLVVSMM